MTSDHLFAISINCAAIVSRPSLSLHNNDKQKQHQTKNFNFERQLNFFIHHLHLVDINCFYDESVFLFGQSSLFTQIKSSHTSSYIESIFSRSRWFCYHYRSIKSNWKYALWQLETTDDPFESLCDWLKQRPWPLSVGLWKGSFSESIREFIE